MAPKNLSSLPVFREIGSQVFDTLEPDPWESRLNTLKPDPLEPKPKFKCLGTSNRDKRRCHRTMSGDKRDYALGFIKKYSPENECPQDDEFYGKVEEFLNHTHCYLHIGDVKEKFETWKGKRVASHPQSAPAQTEQQHGSTDSTTPTEDLSSTSNSLPQTPTIEDLSPTSGSVPQSPSPSASTSDRPVTPPAQIRSPMADVAEIGHDFSGLTVSPNQVSTPMLADESLASTTCTTPEGTPERDFTRDKSPEAHIQDLQPCPATPVPDDREIDEMVAEIPEGNPGPSRDSLKVLYRLRRQDSRVVHQIYKPFGIKDAKVGIVYALRHKTIENIVKVGWSGTTAEGRLQQSSNCNKEVAYVVYESTERFVGPQRVESLVMAALKHRQHRIYTCRVCGRNHREWFEVSLDEMVDTIEAWTAFVRYPAYDNGRLSKHGRWMADMLIRLSPDKVREAIELCRRPARPGDRAATATSARPGAEEPGKAAAVDAAAAGGGAVGTADDLLAMSISAMLNDHARLERDGFGADAEHGAEGTGAAKPEGSSPGEPAAAAARQSPWSEIRGWGKDTFLYKKFRRSSQTKQDTTPSKNNVGAGADKDDDMMATLVGIVQQVHGGQKGTASVREDPGPRPLVLRLAQFKDEVLNRWDELKSRKLKGE